jgi:hypothetical protein
MRACCESIRASRLLDSVSVSRPRLGMCSVLHESGLSGPTVDAEAGRQAHVRCGVIRASQSRRVEKVARLFLCPCRGAHSVSTCISSCGHAVQYVARRHALSVRTHSRSNGISGMQVAPSGRVPGAAALRVRVCVCVLRVWLRSDGAARFVWCAASALGHADLCSDVHLPALLSAALLRTCPASAREQKGFDVHKPNQICTRDLADERRDGAMAL